MITIKCKTKLQEQLLANELAFRKYTEVLIQESFEKPYWEKFVKELSNLSKMTGKLLDVKMPEDKKGYQEVRAVDLKLGKMNLRIEHNWRDDGTSSKPVTTLYLNISEEDMEKEPPEQPDHFTDEVNLGRYAIWTDPKKYAEDIYGQLT